CVQPEPKKCGDPMPARKPTRLKLLQGTARPCRMKNEPEPELLEALPNPPSYLGRDARRLWKLRGPQLVQMGLLTASDLETFETMCTHYGLMTEAARALKKEGILVEGERGLVKNPAAQIHRDNS